MKNAELVTFGTGLLNRAAEHRHDQNRIAKMIRAARILPVWRGKPMVERSSDDLVALAYLSSTNDVLKDQQERFVFLGEDADGAIFAADISDWEPNGEVPDPDQFVDTTWQHLPGTPDTQGLAELRSMMTNLSPLDAEIAATARSILEWHRIHGFCANCGTQSVPTQAGWQRNCPNCGRAHFPRTDPVVIMLITHGNSVLVGRGVGWPDGMYSLLAGFMEPGETIEAATRREVIEETGVKVGRVGYLASQPWPYPSSLMIGTWGEALTTDIQIDPKELLDAIWITREDMLDVFAGRNPSIFPARKGSIAQFLLSNWLADRLD